MHDLNQSPQERFPSKFEIAFVSVAQDRSRMYLDGKPLGDDLTNNAYEDDGYRFHDAFHLANVAHLGWSPVARKMMGKKRKSDPRLDEVEDGARAQIVEELVVKAIHSEGERVLDGKSTAGVHPFGSRSAITFRFLNYLRSVVKGLEVEENQYWEWENAISDGWHVYSQLMREQQGTVTLDLERHAVSFTPDVCIQPKGVVVGIGTASENVMAVRDADSQKGAAYTEDTSTVKKAILRALQLPEDNADQLEVKQLANGKVCVRARGEVQRRMWELSAVCFQTSVTRIANQMHCTAIALADLRDAAR